MRGFVITTILFIILIIMIILNFCFVENVIRDMEEAVSTMDTLPCDNNTVIIDHLKDYWGKSVPLLSLSVTYDDIKDLTDIIDSLQAANETRNINQFQIHVELLLNAIDEIGRLEKLSLENIL